MNFKVVRQDDDILELRYRVSSRLWLGLCALAFGGTNLFMVYTLRAITDFWWVGGGLSLYGLHRLLDDKAIRVDRQGQQVTLQDRVLGLWPLDRKIPFSHIREVRLVERLEREADEFGFVPSGWSYWSLVLECSAPFKRRLLDVSSCATDSLPCAEPVAEAICHLIGCPFSRVESPKRALRR